MQFEEEADLLNRRWKWGLLYENIKDFWENLIFTSLDFWFPVIFILSQGKATVTRQEWRYYRPFRGSEAVWCPPLAAPVAPGLAQNATHRGLARVLRLGDYCYFSSGNYSASTHPFLLVGHYLHPTCELEVHSRLLKYTFHWIDGKGRVKTWGFLGRVKRDNVCRGRGSSGMHPWTKGNKWSLLGERLPIRAHSFVH